MWRESAPAPAPGSPTHQFIPAIPAPRLALLNSLGLPQFIDYEHPDPNVSGTPLWMLAQPLTPNIEKSIQQLHLRGRAATHLADYTVAADILGPGQSPAIHHRVICDAIDGLLDDQYDDLIINTPPGSAKSTYTSHALGSYFLGRRPRDNIILATHTAELAERWSGKVRNTYASEAHQRVFPTGTLSRDTTARGRWATSEGGEFLAVGVGAAILGFRADLCLTENACVQTRTGYNSISTIAPGDEVLGYDESQLSTGYYRVVAVAERRADIIYRIHTADGRVVEATGNHPFHAGGRFVPADSLVVGDTLLSSVSHHENNPRIGIDQATGAVTVGDGVLFPCLCQHLQSATHDAHLCGLLQDLPPAPQEHKLLLPRLFGIASTVARQVVCSVRNGIQSAQQQIEVLFTALQKRFSCSGNVVETESELAAWERPEQVSARQRSCVSRSSENGNVSGQSGVRHLRQHGEPSRTSCGRECAKQQPDQCGNALPVMPHDIAWCGAGETTKTTVARIEVVRGDTRVFDIQVETVANFFANGILVHNCMIDDPIGGFEQAQSETQLAKVQGWYETDLMTRLKPGGKIVLICQRLSPNDLAGYMIARHEMNPTRRMRVLTLRMEYEEGDDDGTERQPGERLWPEWFTQRMVEDAKRDEYRWTTLYQQRPPSSTGDWVGRERLRFVAPGEVPPPDQLKHYLCTDLALSINSGDYTVHLVIGVAGPDHGNAIYVLDAIRSRKAVDDTADQLLSLVGAYKPLECLIDDDNAAKVYMQLLAAKGRERGIKPPMKMLPMRGQDKETRAAPLRGLFLEGRIVFVVAPWNEWMVREVLTFPNAMGVGVDDGIDALGLIGRRLASLARPGTSPKQSPPPPTMAQMCLEELYYDRDCKNNSPYRKRI